VLENVVSNAERRGLVNRESLVVPRISDIYAALPAMTGKLELEYEGEMKGADQVAAELVRVAVGLAFRRHCGSDDFKPVINWFEMGGYVKLPDTTSAREALTTLQRIDGLLAKTSSVLEVKQTDDPSLRVAAAEFVLEGLAATSKISRSEEHGFHSTTEHRPEVGHERPDPAKRRLN
jgi:magnesium chelatase subunit I